MRFVIVTGMSGAGKSTALKILEDVGYFCADNLPIPLVEKFAELACASDSKYDKVALGVDIRNGEAIRGMQEVLEQLMIRMRFYIWMRVSLRCCAVTRRRDAAIRWPETAGWMRESAWSGRRSVF